MRTLRFVFDYISPYALLDAHGTRGPAEVPGAALHHPPTVARIAHQLGVPFALPPAHPFNPLLALRVSSLPMSDGSSAR